MRPSVGRTVHYRETTGGACLAALVVAVHPTGNVNLAVFDENADAKKRFGVELAAGDDQLDGGAWHWPERVEEAPS